MIEKEIKDILEEVNSVYKEKDWLIVKKYLLKSIRPDKRKKFSKRNYLSKKHTLNEYEKSLIEYYEKQFNIKLGLKEKDKHRKLFWQRK